MDMPNIIIMMSMSLESDRTMTTFSGDLSKACLLCSATFASTSSWLLDRLFSIVTVLWVISIHPFSSEK